jgi:hypothetical protein
MVLFLVLGQIALAVFVNWFRPEVRDAEFGTLLTALRQGVAQAPARPLVLVLGSSRTATSIRPSALPAGLGGRGPEPLVFNFSIIAAGPVRELQAFRRLRAWGIRPTCLVVELWPPYLTQAQGVAEAPYVLSNDIQWPDWSVLGLDRGNRVAARRKFLEGLLVPGFAHRAGLLSRYAPCLAEAQPAEDGWKDGRARAAEAGWLPTPTRPKTPEELAQMRLWYFWHMYPILGDFHISPISDAALRELLREALHDGIHVAVLLSPEYSGLRACYSATAQAQTSAYLEQLAEQLGVVVVDTRQWMADEDFADFTHLQVGAAGPYTERLGKLVLEPLLGGRLPELRTEVSVEASGAMKQ